MEAKEILGLDIGAKNTGVARASNVARLAEPLMSISAKKTMITLKKYIAEHKVEAIVIGLPRSLNGEDTEQTKWVRDWVDKAKQKINAPLYYQDEALTTEKAKGYQLKANSSFDEHALAAAIILQDFLDSAEANRTTA